MGKTETVTFQAEITAHFDIPAESKQKDQKYFTVPAVRLQVVRE